MNTIFIKSSAILLGFLLAISANAESQSTAGLAELVLTPEEKAWVADHSKVSFTGDPNWLPYEAFDERGNYIGIVAEHLKLIEQMTGLEFVMSPSATWTESTEKAKQGLVNVLSETDDSDLKSHLNFTAPYISNPIVIAMHNRENYVEGIADISGRRIGLIRDYGYASKIRRKYSQIDFVTVEDIQDGLVSVSTGEIDALLCTLALCSYTISQLNLNNVRITGKTEFDTKLALGVQKNLPELLAILNKAIANMNHEQHQAILDRWIKDKYVPERDYTLAYQIFGVSVFLVTFFAFWNRRLAREVQLRIETEKARDEAEKVLRSQAKIIDQIHDSVVSTDLNGIITGWNSGAERLFGYTAEEKIGQHVSSVYLPEDRQQLQDIIIKELEEQGSLETECRVVRKGGEVFFEHLSLSMLYDEEGTPSGMIGYALDINERKKGEEQISRLASIVRHSQDFIGIADIEANTLFLNEAGKRLVGIESDEFLNTSTVPEFFPDDERAKIEHEVIPAVLDNGRWSGETRFKNFTTGEIIPVWYDMFRIDHPETGEPINFATVTRDIRERKRYEEELRKHRDGLEELVEKRTIALEIARLEAERSNEAKSEFLSRMSHELRTPLNAILGFAQVLELDIAEFNETHQANIKEILGAGGHLLELINELLDLAAIESGKLKVPLEEVALQGVLQQCLTLLGPEAGNRHIRLINEMGEQGVTLQANAIRLKQVLLNLISNAIKYNAKEGSVTLKGDLVDNNRFRIFVIDTGRGLSQDEISRLFVSFERLNEEGRVEGTGIGLVITKYLVEHMGGCVGVESRKGFGSTFWIELPLAQSNNQVANDERGITAES